MKKLIIFMLIVAANSFAAEVNQECKVENKVVKTATVTKKPVVTKKVKKPSKTVSLKKRSLQKTI